MSRRTTAKKRVVSPDPIYRSRLVSMILSRLLQDGKKSLARRIFYEAMENLERKGEGQTSQGGNGSYKMLPANVQVHNSGITSASGAGPVSLSIAVTNATTGSGESHSNIQPVIAAYYIMYIP